jgi:hypothetical protein
MFALIEEKTNQIEQKKKGHGPLHYDVYAKFFIVRHIPTTSFVKVALLTDLSEFSVVA